MTCASSDYDPIIFTGADDEGYEELPHDGWTHNSAGQVHNSPFLTFKGVFLPTGTMVTPLPEAHFHYADFPCTSSDTIQFGSFASDPTYDCVANLEFDGCHFQSGALYYNVGGPAGRTVTFRNNIFEDMLITFTNWIPDRTSEEQVTARNNLFYHCELWLAPITGDTWAFTDNIFDHSEFHGPNSYHGTGPIANNHNNVYVGMGSTRLQPTDPYSFATTLTYKNGPLGHFYLREEDAALMHAGSRPAAEAGLYHFCTIGIDDIQGNNQVNIGPAYLVVNPDGSVRDSNGDGVPDFIADRNGNGVEDADEMPWISANSGTLAILSPAADATVSGTIEVTVNLGADARNLAWLDLAVDSTPQQWSETVLSPGVSIRTLRFDTTTLAQGHHTLSARVFVSQPPPGSPEIPGYVVTSPQIEIDVANVVRFPNWQQNADSTVAVNLETALTPNNFSVYFFSPDYAKSYNPTIVAQRDGTDSSGPISISDTPAALGYPSSDESQSIVSATELTPTAGGPATAPANQNTTKVSAFPTTGKWVVSYQDDASELAFNGFDRKYYRVIDPFDDANNTYFHYNDMGSWLVCAAASTGWTEAPLRVLPGDTNFRGQTWPLRGSEWQQGHLQNDAAVLLGLLADPAVRNYYGSAHYGPTRTATGDFGGYKFSGIPIADLTARLKGHRYRFVYLDTCDSAEPAILSAFGADAALELNGSQGGAPTPLECVRYQAAGLWPAAFLTWSGSVRYFDPSEGGDTQSGIAGTYFRPRAYFSMVLVSAWTMGIGSPSQPEPLAQAIQDAKELTRSRFGNVDSQPNFFSLNNLRHYGYRDLRFDQYNNARTWNNQCP